MSYQTGVVVVGAGFIGPVHVEALRRLGVPVIGILGIDEAESRSAAAKLGMAKRFYSYDQVLADPRVGAVHLATPNRLHFPMAKAALTAGKHVLCEKPLSMTSTESAELVELATKTHRAAAVNYNVRYYPIALQARAMARNGEIGEIYSICGSYCQDWLFLQTDYNWRVLAEEGGELRAVSDIGTHWLDLVQSLSGVEIVEVMADLKTIFTNRLRPKGEVETYSAKLKSEIETEPVPITTEDYGGILLRLSNGGTGVLHVSQVTAGRKNCLRFEIAGSKSALAWNSESPNELWIGHREKANEILLRDPALVDPSVRPFVAFPGGHNEGFPDAFKQCFKAFYDYIEKDDFRAPATYPSFADGHREILLCEAILKSHREQRWVKIGPGVREELHTLN
jgi:predicted dehydrogenase